MSVKADGNRDMKRTVCKEKASTPKEKNKSMFKYKNRYTTAPTIADLRGVSENVEKAISY